MQPKEVATLWRRLHAREPALASARLLADESALLAISVPDIDEDSARKYEFTMAAGSCYPPALNAVPSTVTQSPVSPSGKRRVHFVALQPRQGGGGKERVCLEWWEAGSLLARVDCSALHGKAMLGGFFGSFDWSEDECSIVYHAEQKAPDTPNFFDPPKKEKEKKKESEGEEKKEADAAEEPELGRAADYRDDWGEQLVGSDRVAAYVATFSPATGVSVKPLGVDADVTAGEAVFFAGGVVYTAWLRDEATRRRLGAIFCDNRPCELRWAPLPSPEDANPTEGDRKRAKDADGQPAAAAEPHRRLAESLYTARCPRRSPSGGALAFIGSAEPLQTHAGALAVYCMQPDFSFREIAPRIKALPGPADFPGIYDAKALPAQCWQPDEQAVFVNAQRVGADEIWRVPIGGTAQGSELAVHPAAGRTERLLAAARGASGRTRRDRWPLMLLTQSTRPDDLPILLLRKRAPGEEPAIVAEARKPHVPTVATLPDSPALPPLPVLSATEQFAVPSVDCGVPGALTHCFIVEPAAPEGAEDRPLRGIILAPHGGPHASFPYSYDVGSHFLAGATDCAILKVNYRGGTGQGQDTTDALTGHIGTLDVADCMAALEAAPARLKRKVKLGADGKPIAVVSGGSHGGFLAAHLTGQFPDRFAAAVLRNAVVNLPLLIAQTDIPDWIRVEALGVSHPEADPRIFGRSVLAPEHLPKLVAVSPIVHADKVKASTLVIIGEADRRCPWSQGREWYFAVRPQLGDRARLVCYKNDAHPLDSAVTQAEHMCIMATWLNKQLGD